MWRRDMRRRLLALALAFVMVAGTCFTGNAVVTANAEGEEQKIETSENVEETTSQTEDGETQGDESSILETVTSIDNPSKDGDSMLTKEKQEADDKVLSTQGTDNSIEKIVIYGKCDGDFYNMSTDSTLFEVKPGLVFVPYTSGETSAEIDNFDVTGDLSSVFEKVNIQVDNTGTQVKALKVKNNASAGKYTLLYYPDGISSTDTADVKSIDITISAIKKSDLVIQYINPDYKMLWEIPSSFELGIDSTKLHLTYTFWVPDDTGGASGVGCELDNVRWSISEASGTDIFEFAGDTLLFSSSQVGSCTIHASYIDGEITKKIYLEEAGIYLRTDNGPMTVPYGYWIFPSTVETDVVGDVQSDDVRENLVFDQATLNYLNSMDLLGLNDRTGVGSFEKNEDARTLLSLKGLSTDGPYCMRSVVDRRIIGHELTGNVYYPNKQCSHWDSELCDCDKTETKLNKIHISEGEESYKIPFSITIVENTVANKMAIVDEINSSEEEITEEQKFFMEALLFELAYGYPISGKKYAEPNSLKYSTSDLNAIQQATAKANIDDIMREDNNESVTVANLLPCLFVKAEEEEDGPAVLGENPIPKQTISFDVTDGTKTDATEMLLKENVDVISSKDFSITSRTAGGKLTNITTTNTPLEITMNLGTEYAGQEVSVIREHTEEAVGGNASATTATLLENAEGTTVFTANEKGEIVFLSDKFSVFSPVIASNLKESELPPDDPDQGGNGGSGSQNGAGVTTGGTGSNNGAGVSTTNTATITSKTAATKTGDSTGLYLWMSLLVVAGVAVIVMYRKKKHKA